MKNTKSLVAFGDLHGETKYFNYILPYLKESKPDYLVLTGDIFDFAEISEYDRHKRNYVGLEKLQGCVEREIRWGNSVLDTLDSILPNTKKVFVKGNHDLRYDKYATYEQTHPNPKDRTVEGRLNLKKRGWDFIDIGGYYKIGKLYFMHGEMLNGDLFAKVGAMKFRKNVRLWHHHTNQSYCITSPLDSNDTIETKAVGCMCDKDPVYLRGLTNRWINSFLVANVLPSGHYWDQTINIIQGHFIVDGKLY